MTYCNINGSCHVNGSTSPSFTRCPELCSIVNYFKKNFTRRQPDAMVGEMLKWSAKTAGDQIKEKAGEKVIDKVANKAVEFVTTQGVKKGINMVAKAATKAVGPLMDLLDSESLGHTPEYFKDKIDHLLYLLGENPYGNRQRIYNTLNKIKDATQAIIIEKSWGDKNPECYQGLQQFVKDIERAVQTELMDKGPKIQSSKLL